MICQFALQGRMKIGRIAWLDDLATIFSKESNSS